MIGVWIIIYDIDFAYHSLSIIVQSKRIRLRKINIGINIIFI